MTKDQMRRAKENVEEIARLYQEANKRHIRKFGYSFQCRNYALAFTIHALKKFFKVKTISVSWDEACAIFEGHHKPSEP